MDLSVLSALYSVSDVIFTTIGCWFLFGKCGLDSLWSLVPVIRLYRLSVIAREEDEGKVVMAASAVKHALRILCRILIRFPADDRLLFLSLVIVISADIVEFVYSLRICRGLCRVFRKSRKWILAWIFLRPLMLFYWGVRKDYLPHAEETDASERKGKISSLDMRRASGSLDISIRERRVRSFLSSRVLLKDIRVSVKPGTMVLLLGGSGAGKTTFVNAVTGYEKADAVITLGGRDIYSEFDSMKYDIGFVPQKDLIRDDDTVRMTLHDAALLRLGRNTGKKETWKKVEETLEVFGLASVSDSLVGKLSGGQKKRMNIAMEFVSDPSLFILDEPDSGLDGVLQRDLMERLKAIAEKGKIVIVITHSPDAVIDLFDEVIILAKDSSGTGRLVFSGQVSSAFSFFSVTTMEDIVRKINRRDEGGEGMAESYIGRFEEMRNDGR